MTLPANINEVMALIEEKAIRTREGSFVKLEDVRRLIEQSKEPDESKPDVPERLTVEQARQRIKQDPDVMKNFPTRPQEPGRSVAAQEPQSSSRT